MTLEIELLIDSRNWLISWEYPLQKDIMLLDWSDANREQDGEFTHKIVGAGNELFDEIVEQCGEDVREWDYDQQEYCSERHILEDDVRLFFLDRIENLVLNKLNLIQPC